MKHRPEEGGKTQHTCRYDPKLPVRRQLTCVCEAEALVGPGGVAVELYPQAIGRAVDDVAHHAVACVVPQKTGRSVLAVVHLVSQSIGEEGGGGNTRGEG